MSRAEARITDEAIAKLHARIGEDEVSEIRDVMRRCHWDPEDACKVENPATYGYGRGREAWLMHLCTNWMGDRPAIDIDLEGRNQRDELTTPGHASILLPSREHGDVRWPDPLQNAANLESLIAALERRHAEL